MTGAQAHFRPRPHEEASSSLETSRQDAGASELIVDARGIHAWYGSSHVLHGIDLRIRRGETVGLLGRNGMGKSTLIRTLLEIGRAHV